MGKARRRASSRLFAADTAQQAELLEIRAVPSSVNAVEDTVDVAHNGMESGNVLANDTIPMSGRYDENMVPIPDPTLTYSYSGTNGTLSVDCSPTSSVFGSFLYTPNSSFFDGSDTFTYTIADPSTGGSSTTTVTFNVSDHSTITAQDDSGTAFIEQTSDVIIQVVTSGDSDSDGDELFIDDSAEISCPVGSAVPSADGKSVVYTPPSDGMALGEVEMDVVITDRHGNSGHQKLTIEVGGGVTGPGVFLATRKANDSAFARHSFIIIIPQDQEAYASDPNFSRTIEIEGVNYHYATISGNPTEDEDDDRMDGFLNKDDAAKGWVQMAWGFTCENNDIYNLIQANEAYRARYVWDKVQYSLKPWGTDLDDEFDANCHGYAHGLLDFCGYSTSGVSIAQGWDEMVPGSYFSGQ